MALLIQHVIEGITTGGIYGSLALALVLIYRSTGIINFGQGEMATFVTFVAWQLHEWGFHPALALSAGVLLAAVLGVVVFRVAVRPLMGASGETIVVVTIGLMLAFQAASLWIWGADQRLFFQIIPNRSWTVAGITVTLHAVGVGVAVVALAVLLSAFFRFTRLGLAMRAAAAEREKSPLVGIRVETMLLLGWGLASVIGFMAAVLVAPKLFLSPTMMVPLLLYSLAAATLGGWDSPLGAVVGGIVVGVTESLGATYLSFLGAELRLAIPIVITLAVLLVRPAGLFGKTTVVRA
ncbi:MAG: branched-chain amino acid ABC transporter permease [Rhodoplanes sp.]|uniref:branched-chain amino acid ABC transporter permease n=1 Tax=Rhodoplanes sp. TaxID=1968906 RepID=UPI00184D51AB|nr:branched-chain amino acid ABC transporter permease [Rhodoplanes sp.]NVO17410.1 branched-chain amino acid ABC transporter permease [Rhodoplanes sp.]